MTLRSRLALAVVLTAIPLVAGLVWLRKDVERRAIEEGMREFVLARMEAGGRERCEASPESFGGRIGPPRGRGMHGRRHRPGARGRGREERGPPPGETPGPPAGGGPDLRPEPDGRPPPFPRRGPRPGDTGRADGARRPHLELWAYDPSLASANAAAPEFPPALREDIEDGDGMAGSVITQDGEHGHQIAVRMRWSEGPCAFVLLRRFGRPEQSAIKDLLWGAAILCGVLLFAVLLTAGPIVRRIRRLTADVRRSAEARYAQPVAVLGNDEIAGLAEAFNEAGTELRAHVDSLEEREKTLRDFVANTTHDVMLPLTVLQGHLSALRKRVARGEPIGAELVGDTLEEAHYMGSLLHNLSAVAKLEAGERQVQRDAVGLNALVERATSRHRAMAHAKEVELNDSVPESSLTVLGDMTLIEQAVSNVIHNAVRYNEAGGHVAVLLEARDGRFSLRVVDDGPGIPEEQLAKLPERRFRGESARTRHPDGLGLGLHITRDVAARHGFDLALRRSSHGGLEVELSGALS